MNITDFFTARDVVLDLRASGKARALADLSKHAARETSLSPDAVLGALTHREKLGSTGMGDGIAIPHARLPDLGRPFGLLARLRHAIPFDAVDAQPVDLIFLLLLPTGTHGEHLNALACVARRLRDPAVTQALRRAPDGAALYAALPGPPPPKPACRRSPRRAA